MGRAPCAAWSHGKVTHRALHAARNDAKRVRERHGVGIAGHGEGAEGRFMHQRPQGKVREQEAPCCLVDQVGRLAAQDPLRVECVEGSLER